MKYAYWLACIHGIGTAKKRFFWEEHISAEELYHLPFEQLKRIEGMTEEDAKMILQSKKRVSFL